MIGVFGGTGFYEFLDDSTSEAIDTPYGAPAAPPMAGTIEGVETVFIPRHGLRHEFLPHQVPFRANVWAMKEMGVDRIIGPCAAGSLTPAYEPGHLVVPDQLVDQTSGRESHFDRGPAQYISFADPYCAELRPLALEAVRSTGATVHDGGTTVVIQGPRFSTRAESRWFAKAGWKVINMTQLPEAALAREVEICYVNIAVITDYDVGVEGETEPVTHARVIKRFNETLITLRAAIRTLIPKAQQTPRQCECASALSEAGG